MANVFEVVLVGVEKTARVTSGSVCVTISVTIWLTGDVDLIAAGSGGVSTVDSAVDGTSEGNSVAAGAMTAGLPLA